MTSKTSFFEPALYKRNMRKCVLPAVFFIFVWLFVLPVSILNQGAPVYGSEVASLKSMLLESAQANASIVAFCYGLCIAWLLNFYLFRTNSSYYQASLPIRRETVYLTNYISGLLLYIIPAAVIALLSFGATTMVNAPMFSACFQWFSAGLLGYLFFYSFAFALSMVVGHMAAMPIFYVILNFTAYVVTNIVVVLLSTYVYGLSDHISSAITASRKFSPLIHLLSNGNVQRFYDDAGYFTGCQFRGWNYLAVLAGVGIVFAVLGWLLYRVRHMERSGDVIAIRHLQPVFVYAFTVGCSLVLGIGMMAVLNPDFTQQGAFTPLIVFLFIGAFIGFFLSQMMLKKTMKVFGDKGSWLRYAIVCAVLLVLFGSMKLDLFGYVSYVPDADDVAGVALGEYFVGDETDDPAYIQKVLDLHQRMLDDRDILTASNGYDSDHWYQQVSFRYTLKNGRTVERHYDVSFRNEDYSGSAIEQFEQVYDDPYYIVLREGLPESVSAGDIEMCHIYRYDDSGYCRDTFLTGTEALEFYRTCILPDLKTSSMAKSDLYWRFHTEESQGYIYEVEFSLADTASTGYTNAAVSEWHHFAIPDDAENTMRYLQTLPDLQR